jgi:thiamine pyrophosphate-dependent acetolactate synthase large subunit-like protein
VPRSGQTLTGGEIVVEALRAMGIRQVFGVPGGQTLAITDAMIGLDDIRFIATRHENAAACAADAVGRLTGRPGVCLATTGPGATNLLTGVGGAFRDSSPVLVLTCNNNLRDVSRDDAQAADHVDIFRSLTKRATFIADPTSIPQAMEEAYIVATTGNPGPVLVDFARSAVEARVSSSAVRKSGLDESLLGPFRSLAEPTRVESAARALASSLSPVIWVGNGVTRSGARRAALGLADRLGAPVITTFNAIGAVPSSHPLAFGPKSRMGTSLSSAVLRGADLLLAVGNSLNAISTSRWSLTLPDRIVQIDIEPTQVGRYYGAKTLGLVGDATAVLEQLLDALNDLAVDDAATARRSRLVELQAERDAWRSRLASDPSPSGSIAPSHFVDALRVAAPDDTTLVVDAGNPGVWTHAWEVREQGEYLKPVGFGNMGFALGAAIGAKVVRPAAPVIAVIGDGSMAMTVGDLETLVREQLPVCVVVMNDSGYGNIRQEQLMKFGDRTIGVDFGDVNFATVASGFGVDGRRVTSAAELTEAVRDVLASGRPGLVDAVIDPKVSVWTYPPFLEHEPEA